MVCTSQVTAVSLPACRAVIKRESISESGRVAEPVSHSVERTFSSAFERQYSESSWSCLPK